MEAYENPFEFEPKGGLDVNFELNRLKAKLDFMNSVQKILDEIEEKEKIEKPRREMLAKLKAMAESKNNAPKKWRFK